MPKICPVEFQASQKGWLYLCLLKVIRNWIRLYKKYFCSQTCRGGPSEGGLREIPNVTGLHLHWATLRRNAPQLEIRQKNNQKTQFVQFLCEFAKFGFRVLDFWFQILAFGFLISDFGFCIWDFRFPFFFWISNSGILFRRVWFGVLHFGFWMWGCGFWISGFAFGISGFGFRVLDFGILGFWLWISGFAFGISHFGLRCFEFRALDFGFGDIELRKICPVEFQAAQKGWLYLCLLKLIRD